ncbi:glycosyltransferase family 4 protein [Mucilaginibacter sp. BT774]|uniref:glycosyltransferase family 4 protein n=1 Tax=Mucilaginibacter sp. BT774 TaxID=3062276 RepID=UPI0026771BF2|nr:glycosyltransferase family 4 protein [Mucilaginibacter sp. BT774]MDO3627487.1 glycosyltransferase family 4 protein [Mucilaginibacter sp. BT774]
MKKLAIVTTHPIQYYAPIFRLLTERRKIAIKVFYTWGSVDQRKFDPGFDKTIDWDIPLLTGYAYEFVQNTSSDPGSHHYKGIINPNLIREIKEWSPDGILVFGWAYHSHLSVIRHFKGKVPVYFRGDSTLLNHEKGWKSIARLLFLRWVYRHVDVAFYVGSNNKAYFKRFGMKDRQLVFAPHAIDNDRFSEDCSEEARSLRSSLKISDNDILILYAGKFEDVKNVELLLHSFGQLEQTNVHLLLTGNGVKEMQLKKLAEACANGERVHFLNFKNQSYMPVLYQAADIFCLPSLSETWGLSVNEAMACGKAVLISDMVGCGPDLVKSGCNGMTFKSNDLLDITAKLKKLSISKKMLKEYGHCSKIIIDEWSISKIAGAIENTLTERRLS